MGAPIKNINQVVDEHGDLLDAMQILAGISQSKPARDPEWVELEELEDMANFYSEEIQQLSTQMQMLAGVEPEPPPQPKPTPVPRDAELDSMAAFYGHMEVPDSEPVAGWSLVIPTPIQMGLGHVTFKNNSFVREFVLFPDAQEWCDENLQDPYWCLGEAMLPGDMWGTEARCEFYFTSEHDYILFKMRWG